MKLGEIVCMTLLLAVLSSGRGAESAIKKEVRAQSFVLCDKDGAVQGVLGFGDLGTPEFVLMKDGNLRVMIGVDGPHPSGSFVMLVSQSGDGVVSMVAEGERAYLACSLDDRTEVNLIASREESTLFVAAEGAGGEDAPKNAVTLKAGASHSAGAGSSIDISNTDGRPVVTIPER